MFEKISMLAKYANLKPEDLTVQLVGEIASSLGHEIDPTDELLQAAVTLLRGDSIHKAADLIQKPETMAKLVSLFVKSPEADVDDELSFKFAY